MAASKSLPARPSLESLRKQAKKLAREVSAADAGAIARVRAHLPATAIPLTQRNAQLVIAREYGFAGWQELTAEVSRRTGKGLDWAVARARRVIHDNDVEGLKQLLAEFPALLSWHGDLESHGLLGMATGAYGDAGDPQREGWFTRAACAELLIDAGAFVSPDVPRGILRSRARGLLQLFRQKGLLPDTLDFHAALGDLDAVRAALADTTIEVATVNEAFMRACSFAQETAAALLLDRLAALDGALARSVDSGIGRHAFVRFFIEHGGGDAIAEGPWRAFIMRQASRALHERDLPTFVRLFEREAWLLDDAHVDFQSGIIATAAFVNFERTGATDRSQFIRALLDLDPALARRQPPPPSQAIEHAITYGHTDLIPLLTRIWPLPDDLPHAAGTGNLARVTQWFDDAGEPRLGDPRHHFPHTGVHQEAFDDWGVSAEQKVLDTALAWAVINRHFDVADFLLAHGADISTRWNSHEPASILHHLVFLEDSYPSMQYLVDRGIDMTIQDYRWHSTARGWAQYAKQDDEMVRWLEDAESQQRPHKGVAWSPS